MKIKHSDKSQLVIKDTPFLVGIIFFPAALLMLYIIIENLLKQPELDKDLVWTIVAFLGFFIFGALCTEQSTFTFNIYEQKLRWKRRGLLVKNGGVVPFEHIQNVVLQIGHGGSLHNPSLRLALVTKDKTIPLTRYYAPDPKKNCESIKSAILDIIKKDASRFIEDSILNLLVSGNKIEAVRLAQVHYKMNTTEAKTFIDDLQK